MKNFDKNAKALDEHLRFESLLGDISANLVNLPLDAIDTAIESSMKTLVEFFEVDRCNLGELSGDHTKIIVPYFYSRPDSNIPQITEIGKDYLSFVYETVKQDILISFSKPSELPDSAQKDRVIIEKIGIKSLLVVPVNLDIIRTY